MAATYSAGDQLLERKAEGVNEPPPMMEDISFFLETMHSKNLTLKKLAKVQQERIAELSAENEELKAENMNLQSSGGGADEELRRENEALKLENELKVVEAKELRAQLITLKENLGDANPRPSSAHVRPQASHHVRAETARDLVVGNKENATSPQKAAVGRVMQMFRKINVRKMAPSSVLYTLYTLSRSAVGIIWFLLLNRRDRPQANKIKL